MATRSLSQENTRVAIYARVSTTNHGQDVTLQTRELEQFAEARGWQMVGAYVDAGISGAKDSRPELNRLMADAHKRRFDVVCVWKFDRFARSVSHLLRALETFSALGIAFVSLSEQMDTTTPKKNPNAGMNLEKSLTTKDQFMKALRASYDYCDGAYNPLTDASASEVITITQESGRQVQQ